MNSKDLHMHLCEFTSERRTPAEGEERTFIVCELEELEDTVGGGIYIIDPAIPQTCNGSVLLQLSHSRHCAMSIQSEMHDLISEHMDKVGRIRNHTEHLGLDNVLEALSGAKTEGEFKAALKKAISRPDNAARVEDAIKRIISDTSPPSA
jgi:hypothetical protein